jgi:hypothetical protein
VRKPEEKELLGRPRSGWDNIKINLKEIKYGGVDWIHHEQNADQWRTLVTTIINLLVP